MRVLIISDIHGNLTALETVLADAGDYDSVWCLGDLVGYGPDPNECVARVRELPNLTCLMGNHDKAAIGEIDVNAFNTDARLAVSWTQRALSDASRRYLATLPERIVYGDYTLVHASPSKPIWEYILDRNIAARNFNHFDTLYCLVGHTHIPVMYVYGEYNTLELRPAYDDLLQFSNERLIVNPGSVGQPRDSNPDAAYALLDLETNQWEYRRVPYDIAETQRRMETTSLPARLRARLGRGW